MSTLLRRTVAQHAAEQRQANSSLQFSLDTSLLSAAIIQPGPGSVDSGVSEQQGIYDVPDGSCLPGPSAAVQYQLTCGCGAAGSHLVSALSHAARDLDAAALAGAGAAAPEVVAALQDCHACLVAVDDQLDELRISASALPALGETRQWLNATDKFVLARIKQVQAFSDDAGGSSGTPAGGGAASSSMDDASSSHSSVDAMSVGGGPGAWRALCHDAAEALHRATEQITGASGSDSPSGQRSRLVARRSRLSYAQHWSRKVAI